MASVYGDILVHFPELIISLPYFAQEPKVGAGYIRDANVQYISCIRQTGAGRKINAGGKTEAWSGAIAPVLKITDRLEIWTDTRLNIGFFMIYKDDVYRIVEEKDWVVEAGFYAYLLEKLVGNDGSEIGDLSLSSPEF